MIKQDSAGFNKAVLSTGSWSWPKIPTDFAMAFAVAGWSPWKKSLENCEKNK